MATIMLSKALTTPCESSGGAIDTWRDCTSGGSGVPQSERPRPRRARATSPPRPPSLPAPCFTRARCARGGDLERGRVYRFNGLMIRVRRGAHRRSHVSALHERAIRERQRHNECGDSRFVQHIAPPLRSLLFARDDATGGGKVAGTGRMGVARGAREARPRTRAEMAVHALAVPRVMHRVPAAHGRGGAPAAA